jgi:hypothetical protein
LSPLTECGSCRRKTDNVFAGGESRAILTSSAGTGPSGVGRFEFRLRRGRQRFDGQGVEMAASAVKQSRDEG